MTNKFNFTQALKNKKIWAAAAVVIGIAAVADSMGSEYAGYYESDYGYPQGSVTPSYPPNGNYAPRYGGGGYMPNPSMPSYSQPYTPSPSPIQPTFNADEQMRNWQERQNSIDNGHKNYVRGIHQ